MEKKKLSLPAQIFIALLLGIVVGLAFYFMGKPEITTNYLKPFGTIFVNLLKFIVVPVVLLSMIDGIVSMGDMKKVGSVGWKTVAYFLVTTAIACVIGLVFANIFNNAGLFPTLQLVDGQVWEKATSANFMDTLIGIFPSNLWESFRTSNMLQVIVIAILLGGGILTAEEKGKLAQDMVTSLYAVIERVMAFIISLSPIGVFTMLDGGKLDEKIIAIPFSDPSYNKYRDIMDLPDHTFDEMAHFFTVYKALEGKEAVAGDVNGREAAVEIIKSALAHYDECFGNKK